MPTSVVKTRPVHETSGKSSSSPARSKGSSVHGKATAPGRQADREKPNATPHAITPGNGGGKPADPGTPNKDQGSGNNGDGQPADAGNGNNGNGNGPPAGQGKPADSGTTGTSDEARHAGRPGRPAERKKP